MDSFEFTPLNAASLVLFGELVAWTDEINTGLAEHLILKRAGAIHQNTHTPPREFAFQCVIVGRGNDAAARSAEAQQRYQLLADTMQASPEGQLVHPRFGVVARAVCKGINASETPGELLDTITYTIRFAETGLKDLLRTSPTASAAAASEAAQQLVDAQQKQRAAQAQGVQNRAAEASQAALQGATLQVQAKTASFDRLVGQVSTGQATVPQLTTALRELEATVDSFDLAAVKQAPLRAAAALVYGHAAEAYAAVLAGRPPIVPHTVQETISVARLAAQLYGGKFAKARAAELMQLNRIPDPFAIPPGTVLILSDPASVRNNA